MLKFKMNYFLNEIDYNNLRITDIQASLTVTINASLSYLQAKAYQFKKIIYDMNSLPQIVCGA